MQLQRLVVADRGAEAMVRLIRGSWQYLPTEFLVASNESYCQFSRLRGDPAQGLMMMLVWWIEERMWRGVCCRNGIASEHSADVQNRDKSRLGPLFFEKTICRALRFYKVGDRAVRWPVGQCRQVMVVRP